jgi:hypothetical protein
LEREVLVGQGRKRFAPQENEETTMNTLFEREVYIRLSEDGTNFVSTTRYGRFFARVKNFALSRNEAPDSVQDKAPVSAKRRLLADEPDE